MRHENISKKKASKIHSVNLEQSEKKVTFMCERAYDFLLLFFLFSFHLSSIRHRMKMKTKQVVLIIEKHYCILLVVQCCGKWHINTPCLPFRFCRGSLSGDCVCVYARQVWNRKFIKEIEMTKTKQAREPDSCVSVCGTHVEKLLLINQYMNIRWFNHFWLSILNTLSHRNRVNSIKRSERETERKNRTIMQIDKVFDIHTVR